MRITNRAATETAHLLSISVEEARVLLAAWIAAVLTTQAGKPQDSGCTEYRGPKPWRLMMLVDDNDVGGGRAVVDVRPSTSTRLMLNAPAKQLQTHVKKLQHQASKLLAAPALDPLQSGISIIKPETQALAVRFTPPQQQWLRRVAERRGISVEEWVRTLVADAMEDD
jgi:hypothetical protein